MLKQKIKKEAVVLFAKAPIEGRCKSRLIPDLGVKEATKIYKKVLEKTIANLFKLKDKRIFIFYAPRGQRGYFERYTKGLFLQRGRGLGQRMFNAFCRVFSMGFSTVVLIGSDIPGLDEEVIEDAFEKLEASDVVFGPATDGGYYLVGLKRPYRELFSSVKWSSPETLRQSIEIAKGLGLRVSLIRELTDLDRVDDYINLNKRGLL